MKKFYCNNCNAEVSEKDTYCPECGILFDDELDYQDSESFNSQKDEDLNMFDDNDHIYTFQLVNGSYDVNASDFINADFNFDIKNPIFTYNFYFDNYIETINLHSSKFDINNKLDLFLKIYRGLIYKPLSINNFIQYVTCLVNNSTSLSELLDKKDVTFFENKVKKLAEMFAEYGIQLLHTPTSYGKSLDPFIAAGIANGIAGVGAAVLVGAQQAAKQVQVEQYNNWVSSELSKLSVAQEQLFNVYNDVERIIFKSSSAAMKWENLKYETYKKSIDMYKKKFEKAQSDAEINFNTKFFIALTFIVMVIVIALLASSGAPEGVCFIIAVPILLLGLHYSMKYYKKK